MKYFIEVVATILAIFLSATVAERKIVFCYYGSWAVYRTGDGTFTPNDINPFLCTHVGYSFFGVNVDGSVKSLDIWADMPGKLDGIGKLQALKKINPNLKTSLVVGGWNEGGKKYSDIAKSADKMKKFIDTALQLMQEHKFDGLDLDWEYPGIPNRGGVPEDKQNFVTFVKLLKEALSAKNYTLTAAVGAPQSKAELAYNIPEISKYLDYIHLMAYDFYGSWDDQTGVHAPLEGSVNPKFTVKAVVDYWLSQHVPPQKLILGLGTYGQSFTLKNPSDHGMGAPTSGGGAGGELSKQDGFLGYNEICQKLKSRQLTEVFDNSVKTPYAYGGNFWVGYDNPHSITLKANLVNEKNLGGAMIWSVETDDFRGRCGQKYPLLTAINAALNNNDQPSSTIKPSQTTTTKPTQSSTQATATTKGSTVPPGKQFVCPSADLFRNPADCSQFYNCIGSGLTPSATQCPTGLLFDDESKVCNWAAQVKC